MDIKKTVSGAQLTCTLGGRLDTITAPQLESVLSGALTGISELIFDLTELEYISSAGLRVLLSAHKAMKRQEGRMLITGVCESVMDVFRLTGFTEIFTIEA